ncbi:MAG TPA: hypothetical protein VKD70_06045 [Candidatus Acidoferrum sp.]|nr:hypothetical protein [Candidatus Acidoferrum sp.]
MAKKKAKVSAKAKKAKAAKRKTVPTKKPLRRARVAVDRITSGNEASTLDPKGHLIDESELEPTPREHKGDLSGDLQGLSNAELYDSESVIELSEEGQDLEAELIEGVEDALDPDQGEVRVHEAPQKYVPEYKDRNRI